MFELFSVPSQGGAAVKLSGSLVAGGDVADDAVFSPDGGRVLYRADQRTDEVVELYSVADAGGGTSLRISGEMITGGNVTTAAFSPDGSQVIYLADQEVDEVFELFAVASSGGDARKISGPMTPGGDVADWQFSPDGRTLVYRADQEVDGRFELFAVTFSEDLAGDFNNDGVVNAADYTVWRDRLSGAADGAEKYGIWKSNFGRKSGEGQAAAISLHQPVPEPATCVLLVTAIVTSIRRGRRREREPRRRPRSVEPVLVG